MVQIPRGPADLTCPLHAKKMEQVCHKCPWWCRVAGKNPQSEEILDDWRCAVALLPMLLIENAQQSRGVGAAVESFRNNITEGIQQLAAQRERSLLDGAKPGLPAK